MGADRCVAAAAAGQRGRAAASKMPYQPLRIEAGRACSSTGPHAPSRRATNTNPPATNPAPPPPVDPQATPKPTCR
jgi:hypothetical protein